MVSRNIGHVHKTILRLENQISHPLKVNIAVELLDVPARALNLSHLAICGNENIVENVAIKKVTINRGIIIR